MYPGRKLFGNRHLRCIFIVSIVPVQPMATGIVSVVHDTCVIHEFKANICLKHIICLLMNAEGDGRDFMQELGKKILDCWFYPK